MVGGSVGCSLHGREAGAVTFRPVALQKFFASRSDLRPSNPSCHGGARVTGGNAHRWDEPVSHAPIVGRLAQ